MAGVALAWAAPASTAPITLRFEGSVSSLHSAYAPALLPTVQVGDPIVAILTFDSASGDADPDPTAGSYASSGAPFGIHVQVGSVALTSAPEVEVTVYDDWLPPRVLLGPFDSFVASAPLASPEFAFADTIAINSGLQADLSILPSDALPQGQEDLSAFSSFQLMHWVLVGDPGSPGGRIPFQVFGGPVALVPEAGPPLLLLAGLASLRAARGRRARG